MSNKERLAAISAQMIAIPNGTVGKPYVATLDFKKWGWDDIDFIAVNGLQGPGLALVMADNKIVGIPVNSGEFKLAIQLRFAGEEETEVHEKNISITINPDPKTLWKNKPSNPKDKYWKADDVAISAKLGGRQLVVASKRGRSHANVGSFRDDDFAFKYLESTGWSVVTVADGAGSARQSRKGSEVATRAVIDYFQQDFTADISAEFDETLLVVHNGGGDEAQKKLSQFISGHLAKAAWSVHQVLAKLAKEEACELKEFHTTLIFTLFKQYSFGYAFLTFGVGDCPIALIDKNGTSVTLLNWLDVGEYGGGTRFITMPEIFTSDKFYTRFKFKLVEDFSYLMMMTDGIYDPKFVVEANLEKPELWQAFIADLKGENEDGAGVDFSKDNKDIAEQLSKWMDFWSPGNHDDRTLAIVF